MKESKQRQLTLDQIAAKFNMSICEVNTSINKSYNKIVTELVTKHGIDIWDAVVELKNMFAITEKEAVDKLNEDNKELLKKSAEARSRN
jgi:hypothetical protein